MHFITGLKQAKENRSVETHVASFSGECFFIA